MNVRPPEYWVMRIVMAVPRDQLVTSIPHDVAAEIDRGNLCVVGGEICEPLCYEDSQEKAIVVMEKRAAATGQPHKVVLNQDTTCPNSCSD